MGFRALTIALLTASVGAQTSRVLRSDFALTLTSERERWVGYRDTFEVDGVPVRDREERLQRLLSGGANH